MYVCSHDLCYYPITFQMSENMGEDGQRMMEQMRGHMTDFMENANDWLGELGEAGQKQIMDQLAAHPELMDMIVEQNPGKPDINNICL